MRTTLDLDDGLLEALRRRYPDVSKTAAIEQAIREHLAADATERLRRQAGSFRLEDASDDLRRVDRHT
ncbi:MAG: type II toxin-antitoxin system VapB family antitoxin [Candidatus Dormibacteria bacterium]